MAIIWIALIQSIAVTIPPPDHNWTGVLDESFQYEVPLQGSDPTDHPVLSGLNPCVFRH